MSDLAATITALGTLVASFGALVAALAAFRQARTNTAKADAARIQASLAATTSHATERQVVEIGGILHEVGDRIDGRLTELLREAKSNARTEGYVLGEHAARRKGDKR